MDDSDERRPLISCPDTHPFAYQAGARCCQTRQAGVDANLWTDWGIFLSLDSLTCSGDSSAGGMADVACPVSRCVDSDIVTGFKCQVVGLTFESTGKLVR